MERNKDYYIVGSLKGQKLAVDFFLNFMLKNYKKWNTYTQLSYSDNNNTSRAKPAPKKKKKTLPS